MTMLRMKLTVKQIMEIYANLSLNFRIMEDHEYYDNAMKEFLKYDGTVSFFDSMFIHLMEELEICELVSFDSDFDKVDGIIRIH
jgi:predicted nucleic acid-binding protein